MAQGPTIWLFAAKENGNYQYRFLRKTKVSGAPIGRHVLLSLNHILPQQLLKHPGAGAKYQVRATCASKKPLMLEHSIELRTTGQGYGSGGQKKYNLKGWLPDYRYTLFHRITGHKYPNY